MTLEGREILEYACARFEDARYDEALEAFVLAYGKGYEKEWILENIYNCYMEANEPEFRQVYSCLSEKCNISYEACILDFVPYKEGEYFIFDKEEACFRGVFSVNDVEQAEMDSELQKMEFSAVALELGWDWNDMKHILTDAKNRKLYVVCDDLNRAVSYWKIPELSEYMRNVMLFSEWEEFEEYFHNNTAVYLPKLFYGTEEGSKRFCEITQQEHAYRLTPEGRNTENVLLSIAIPTANRGNLLLKRLENLLQMQYDSEIEISISKNGTKYFEDEYKMVSQIPDARINYYDHGCDLKYIVNWSYAVEMAHGKYVMFVSDEDEVIIDALEHYMKLLSDYSDLSLLRAKTNLQNSAITERKYGRKGVEAFECEFSFQNYISGLVVKREIFLQENLLELERFSKNWFYQYYPHEWWCAMLSVKGDYMEEPVLLVVERESVQGEEMVQYREEGTMENMALPNYAIYQARLDQFQGQIEFLQFFCNGNSEMEVVGLKRAIQRTAYLLELARRNNYDCNNYINMVNQYVDICIKGIEDTKLDNIRKKELLMCVSVCCTSLVKLDERLNMESNNDMQ
ncbi:MAG: glycosyltransferase [Lachnospiraceae bacterium]|nr:glycosyltransferase [Lachnospiraceae bacterium]